MDLDECFGKRLLRRDAPSPGKSNKAFRAAAAKLDRARALVTGGFFEEAEVAAYTAMFNNPKESTAFRQW